MAERNLIGKDYLLFMKRQSAGTYDLVICLTSQTVSRTTDELDAASKCGPSTSPGQQKNNVTFEGQVMLDPDSGRISEDELDDFWRETVIFDWKIGRVVPTEGDITYFGTGYISKLDTTFGLNDPSTYSGAIGVVGIIQKTTATS